MLLPCTDIPHLTELHFIEFHLGCIFFQIQAKDCDSLNCDSHFIVIVWNETYSNSEICVCVEVINSEVSLDSESERNRGQC